MIEKNKFLQLTDELVASEFPEHFEVYEFEKNEIYKQLSDADSPKTEISLNKSGVPIVEIIGYIGMAFGLWDYLTKIMDAPEYFKKIREYLDDKLASDKRDKEIEELKGLLLQSLLKKGVPENKANKIVSKFFAQINQVIK